MEVVVFADDTNLFMYHKNIVTLLLVRMLNLKMSQRV